MVPVSIGEIAYREAGTHSDQELAMSRRSESPITSDPLTLAAGTWLACGMVLYGLTPLPLHDATLGWSPAFWLLAAPLMLLVAKVALLPRLESSTRRPIYRGVSFGVAVVRSQAMDGRSDIHGRQRRHRCNGAERSRDHGRSQNYAATPLRFASIRRSSSRMMR
jgi:hypothetical protein